MNEVAYAALGGLIVLTVICLVTLLVVREFWLWAKKHLSTFESINAGAKAGKIVLGATIEDVRGKQPEVKPEPVQNGTERHPEHLVS